MAITFTTALPHNESSSASSIATSSATPAVADCCCGFVLSATGLTSITDSITGALPGAQIINLGTTTGGSNGCTVYFWYEPNIAAATARTFTAALPSAGPCGIIGGSFAGLPSSGFYDTAVQGFTTGTSANPTTPQTGPTTAANELVLVLYNPDGTNSITYASPNTITVGTNSGFNGLGSTSAGAGFGVPRYDAGYYIATASGLAQGTIGTTTSGLWGAGIVGLSSTATVPPQLMYHRRNVVYFA